MYSMLFLSYFPGITCTVASLRVVAYTNKSPILSSYQYDAEVIYTCVTGYEPHTAGSYTIRCTAIDTWTGTYPVCSSMSLFFVSK